MDSPWESLINSESIRCEVKISQIKAPIAANSQSIGKIGNDELAYFNEQMLIHELIIDSLMPGVFRTLLFTILLRFGSLCRRILLIGCFLLHMLLVKGVKINRCKYQWRKPAAVA
jgi:hypothetical protein